jgi:hypothetical protein
MYTPTSYLWLKRREKKWVTRRRENMQVEGSRLKGRVKRHE